MNWIDSDATRCIEEKFHNKLPFPTKLQMIILTFLQMYQQPSLSTLPYAPLILDYSSNQNYAFSSAEDMKHYCKVI
jgi:hypothetical protein